MTSQFEPQGSIDAVFDKKELSIVQKVLVQPVAKDFAAVFGKQYQARSYDEIGDVARSMEFLILPGQAFIRTFNYAFQLRDAPDIAASMKEEDIERNDWRLLLGIGGVGILFGLFAELAEGGGGKKISGLESRPPSVNLYPNVIISSVMAAISPELVLPTVELLTILKLITVPYVTYHEFAHAIRGEKFDKRFNNKLQETWTDFWIKVVSEYGKVHNPSFLSKTAHALVMSPLTAGAASFGLQTFDRVLMRSFIDNIEEVSKWPRSSILKAMAQLYCDKDEELLDLLYSLTKGKEKDIFGLFEERGSQERRSGDLRKLLRQP